MAQLVQAGRLLLSPFTSVAGWYNRTAQAYPFTVGVVTTGLKTSAADVFAQKVVEGREDFDWTRHAAFCAFGFAYLGGFQYWLYNIKFTQWCGPLTRTFGHKATAPIKTFIDQGIHHPFVYFPSFFAIKAAVSGQPLSSAVDKYQSEIWDSLKALWMVWVPAQFVNFAFVPRHLRIPYVAAVSFGWTVILSVMQGKFDEAIQQRQKVVEGAAGAGAAAAAAAATAASAPAPAAPAPPSLLPAAAAAAVQQEAAAAAAAAAAAKSASAQAVRGLPQSPIVAAAVAEVPAHQSTAVEEA
ncbi:hypothetical protein ABPG75_002416 [Micractinium tetrahymenae]